MSSDQTPSHTRLMYLGIGGLTPAAMLVANGLASRSRHEQAVSQWASTFAEKGLGVSKSIGDLAGPMAFAILIVLSGYYSPFQCIICGFKFSF